MRVYFDSSFKSLPPQLFYPPLFLFRRVNIGLVRHSLLHFSRPEEAMGALCIGSAYCHEARHRVSQRPIHHLVRLTSLEKHLPLVAEK